jgi:hypothetical protein
MTLDEYDTETIDALYAEIARLEECVRVRDEVIAQQAQQKRDLAKRYTLVRDILRHLPQRMADAIQEEMTVGLLKEDSEASNHEPL